MRRTVRKTEDEAEEEEAETEEEEEAEEGEEEAGDGEELVQGGWEGYRNQKSKSGGYAEFLRLEEEPVLIKFLESAPFASFQQHWIDRRQGKRSWVCVEDDCPLCDLGDDPGFRIAFNVLVLSEGKPLNKVWEVGPSVAEQISAKAKDKRTSPIDRLDVYWAASRTGKKQQTRYALDPVKERDIEEDWEIEPLDEVTLKKYIAKAYDRRIIKIPTRKQLRDIAAEVSDDYDVDTES